MKKNNRIPLDKREKMIYNVNAKQNQTKRVFTEYSKWTLM